MINTEPFFILANPRSGSSLLRIICESHRNITVPPESGFLEWWYPKYKDWNQEDSNNPTKINTFSKDLKSSKKFETYHFSFKQFKQKVLKTKPKNYSELIALVYISFGLNSGKNIKIWGDKNNYYIHKTSLLHHLFPNAKYIHLVRDGRDVATSYMALKKIKSSSLYVPKLTSNITEIASQWNSNNFKLNIFLKNIPSHRVLLVRYEDLILNLKQEGLRITNFLNIPFDENMLNYFYLNRKKTIEPIETLDWKKKTLQEPDKTNIGKFKDLLTNKQINIFNSIAKESLQLYKYEY